MRIRSELGRLRLAVLDGQMPQRSFCLCGDLPDDVAGGSDVADRADALAGPQREVLGITLVPLARRDRLVARDLGPGSGSPDDVAFAVTRPGSRATGCLPRSGLGRLEGSVWRIRPAAVEQGGVDRVCLARFAQSFPVGAQGAGLLAHHESRAKPAR